MTPEQKAEERAEKRRAALVKARATAQANRERRAALRQSQERTAEDVLPQHPTEAQRAELAREPTIIGTRGKETDLPARRRRDERTNAMEIPSHLKKRGWDYQFMSITVLGQPVDRSQIRDYMDNGAWRPCKAGEFRDWGVTDDLPDDAPIEIMGCRLYQRPMSYTVQARQEDFNAAEQQRRDKVLAAAAGRSTGQNDPGMLHNRAVHTVPLDIQIEEAQGRLGSGRG